MDIWCIKADNTMVKQTGVSLTGATSTVIAASVIALGALTSAL